MQALVVYFHTVTLKEVTWHPLHNWLLDSSNLQSQGWQSPIPGAGTPIGSTIASGAGACKEKDIQDIEKRIDIAHLCSFTYLVEAEVEGFSKCKGLEGGKPEIGVADTFWLFIFMLNSIFNSKLNQKYSFKKLFNSKNSKIIQKWFNSKNSKNYSFKLGK